MAVIDYINAIPAVASSVAQVAGAFRGGNMGGSYCGPPAPASWTPVSTGYANGGFWDIPGFDIAPQGAGERCIVPVPTAPGSRMPSEVTVPGTRPGVYETYVKAPKNNWKVVRRTKKACRGR